MQTAAGVSDMGTTTLDNKGWGVRVHTESYLCSCIANALCTPWDEGELLHVSHKQGEPRTTMRHTLENPLDAAHKVDTA